MKNVSPDGIRTTCFLLLPAFLLLACTGSGPKKNRQETVSSSAKPIRFLVGSSDRQREHSIYLCELDPANPEFTLIDSFQGASGPSYLAVNQEGTRLYAIDNTVSDPETGEHSVTSFRIERDPFLLEVLNRRSSMGRGPCHLSLNSEGTYLFVANYSSGHTAAYPIGEDGGIMEASAVVRGNGSGPVESRQRSPHAHQAVLDPLERYLLVPDLGADRVFIYEFNRELGSLEKNPLQEGFPLEPGSGPRHLDFHPSGDLVFIVNELNSTVTSCRYDRSAGILTGVETLSTVGPDTEPGYPAAIRSHPSGNALYASTRDDLSTLAVFHSDEEGWLTRQQVITVPYWPRDFNMDPSGRWMLVAGERSGEIRLYGIDGESGELTDTGISTTLPSPGCILFL